MQEENKEKQIVDGDGSGPIAVEEKPVAKVKPVVKKEKEIKTHKTYRLNIYVDDPLPQASDITVEICVGTVTYDEATDAVSTECLNPKYSALFNVFSNMTYEMETSDAPIQRLRSEGKEWVLNLPNALDLNVGRGRHFFAKDVSIINEEPIIE